MSQLYNRECPICLEEFEINDTVKYGCKSNPKHWHHEKCFDEMLLKNKYTCAICRCEPVYIYDRQFYPCACLQNSYEVFVEDADTQFMAYCLPILYPLGFLVLPFIELELCIRCCFTRQTVILNEDYIVTTKIK